MWSNFYKLRFSYVRSGDPIAANRLCYNLSIISQIAAQIGRLLLIYERIGERSSENWRHDMDIVTIDWFSGMHTDKQDKYDCIYTKEYIEKIHKIHIFIKKLTTKDLQFIQNDKKLCWILTFWNKVISKYYNMWNKNEMLIQRPNATTCTWFDIDIEKNYLYTN